MATIVTVNWQGPKPYGDSTLEDVFVQARDINFDHTVTKYLRGVDEKDKLVKDVIEKLMVHSVCTLYKLMGEGEPRSLYRIKIDRDKYVYANQGDEIYVK